MPARRCGYDKPNGINGVSLSVYAAIISYFCGLYGVKAPDLFSAGYVKPVSSGGFTADGIHPNDEGHLFIAEKVCEFF